MKIFIFIGLLLSCDHAFSSGSINKLRQGDILKDEYLQKAIYQSGQIFNSNSNSLLHYSLYNVENPSHQIVSGKLYKFTATFVPSNCRKKNIYYGQTLANCKPSSVGIPMKCEISSWVQPWLNKQDTHVENCKPIEELDLHENLHHVGLKNPPVSKESFEAFKQAYSKSYNSIEEGEKRFKIFESNVLKAKMLQLFEQGSGVYGVTEFSDYTQEEFKSMRLGPNWDKSKKPKDNARMPLYFQAPAGFDWRSHGAVTPVKNQGSCGSCWAFSTTGNIEGQWKVKKGTLLSLSEQELVDCDKVDNGCGGGLPSNAYKAIIRFGGIVSESSYPYTGRGGSCKKDSLHPVAYINGSVSLPKDEEKLATWLAANSPISIGINAFAMQFYRGGVSHPWKVFCNPTKLDHGVLIVGYGATESNEPYWIIKNSWGPGWGDKGYYLVYRGDGTCGLNTMATSSIVH